MPAQHRFYLPPRPRFLDTLLFDKKLSRGRVVGSVFTPLGGPRFTPLGGTSIYAAWHRQSPSPVGKSWDEGSKQPAQ